MKKVTWITILASALLLGGIARAEEGFKVIVNSDNAIDSLSKAKVSSLLMKKTRKWDDGMKVAPVDQKTDSEARESLSQAAAGHTKTTTQRAWLMHPVRKQRLMVVLFIR